MFAARKVSLFIMSLLLCVGYGSMVAAGIDDHRIKVKIDDRVNIVPGSDTRAMLGMVRHPDGTCIAALWPNVVQSVTQGAMYRLTWSGSPEFTWEAA